MDAELLPPCVRISRFLAPGYSYAVLRLFGLAILRACAHFYGYTGRIRCSLVGWFDRARGWGRAESGRAETGGDGARSARRAAPRPAA